MADILQFSELAPQQIVFDGDKVKLDDLCGKGIVIIGFKFGKSKFNTNVCTEIQFYYQEDTEQKHYVCFSGSKVLEGQLKSIEDRVVTDNIFIPFKTKIEKIKNYYSLT